VPIFPQDGAKNGARLHNQLATRKTFSQKRLSPVIAEPG
jgi:hypothetical protein